VVVVIKGRKRLFTRLLKAIYTAIVFSLASQFNLLHRFQLRLGDSLVKAASLVRDATGVKICLRKNPLARLGDFADTRPLDQLTIEGRHEPVTAFGIMNIRDFVATDILNPDYNTRTK